MKSNDQGEELILEQLPKDDWEQREVYAHFGLAIYLCQCLESGVVNYLALLRANKLGRRLTDAEYDELFERLFGGTLGRNLREVRDLVGDDWELAPELTAILKLRNDLVHHWMRDRALEQGTSAKRRATIAELESVAERLEATDAKLRTRVQHLLAAGGVTDDWVREEYERLRQLAETDPEPHQRAAGAEDN